MEIIAELTETEIGLTKETLQSQTTLEKSYELVMQHLKQQELFFAPTAESDQLKAIVDSFKAQIHAQLHYQPQGDINAPIVLFCAQEQPEENYIQNENWDWNQYTSEKMTLVQESGSFHTTQKSKKSDFLKKSDFSMVWILLLSCTRMDPGESLHYVLQTACQSLDSTVANISVFFNEYDKQLNIPVKVGSMFSNAALFVIEYALAKLWMSYGIHPETM